MRNDFLRVENDNNNWFFNPDWQIRPSIAYIDGRPKVLTYEDHPNGSDEKMIHLCQWKHNIPCGQSDWVGQIVLQSRTIRTGKASTYSNEWKMFEQRGTFEGIILNLGKFHKFSVLQFENENRAISNRLDINSHLDSLYKHKIISNFIAEKMRFNADIFWKENDTSKYCTGACYVQLEAASYIII